MLPLYPSACNGQTPVPRSLLDHWDTYSYGPLVVPQLPHGCVASWQLKVDQLLEGSQGKHNVVWSALGHAVVSLTAGW